MRPLRILHVVFSSRIAGSERYCIDLANRQAAMGHDVHVAGMTGTPIAAALNPGVMFHGFRSRLFRGLLLRRLVSALQADICHGHLSAACKALGSIEGAHGSVATLHVGYKAHQHSRLDGLICVNRSQTGRLADYRGLVRTIPNWMPAAPNNAPCGDLRAELGLAPETFLVGAVGRLHPSKGMDVLVDAFRTAIAGPAALVIFGEGPQRPDLERLRDGDPRIFLPGFRAVVPSLLRELDLFVSPSREESFGLAILEAMEVGLPVIATAAEGPSEFLLDQPVEMVAPGSRSALTDALAEAYTRFMLAGELPRVSYDLSAFDTVARVSSINDFYASILAARSVGGVARATAVAVAT